jgi:hypothetical protein
MGLGCEGDRGVGNDYGGDRLTATVPSSGL